MGKDVVESVYERLEKFLQTKTVVGEPIVVGSITLIPIISVSFGLGGGGGEGGTPSDTGSGSGAGAGGRVSPKAILVIKNDEVSLLPISDKGSLEKIIEMVPGIVEKLNVQKQNSEPEPENA